MAERPVFSQTIDARFGLGDQIAAHWDSLGLIGRRAAVTAVGAVFALSFGVAAADVVRLPADMQDTAQTDQMAVQTELPSDTAARTYALANPPVYNVAAKADDDATVADSAPDFTIPSDEASTKVAYTTPSATDEDTTKTDEQTQAPAVTDATPAAAPVAAAATSEDAGA